jgi:hypothetical protein
MDFIKVLSSEIAGTGKASSKYRLLRQVCAMQDKDRKNIHVGEGSPTRKALNKY